jgi:hypothetical protein
MMINMEELSVVKTELEPSETNTIAILVVNKSVRSECRSNDFGFWRAKMADYRSLHSSERDMMWPAI